MIINYVDIRSTQCNGDCSLKNKKCKEFCQLKLNLPIMISYIPDFENDKTDKNNNGLLNKKFL